MIMFRAYGHEKVLATHKSTLMFTKDEDVTPAGDCIVGVAADFDAELLRDFVQKHRRVKITLKTGGLKEVIHANTNPGFCDDRELVVRMGEHKSPRTFAVRADKSAKFLGKEFVDALKLGSAVEVDIEEAVE